MNRKKALFLLFFAAFGFFLYSTRLELRSIIDAISVQVGFKDPCAPIAYSIGSLDSRFGSSKEKFVAEALKAEKIWEDASGRNLFEYREDGNLKINFIYDYRQSATDKLKSIGYVINNDKATYDSLKSRYESLLSSYNAAKTSLDSEVAKITADKAAFEKQVEYWNSRKGAPKNEYARLEELQSSINARIDTAQKKQSELNHTADTINSLTTVINQLIVELKLNVKKYNTTTEETGEEFSGGEYIRDASGEEIDIYQFDNSNKLLRVLAHELGHARGLGHVDDPSAIMYKLNESDSDKPTASDIAELDHVCR